MNWEAIKYVSSGFTLVAFIIGAVVAVLRDQIRQKEGMIEHAPEGDRARLVEKALEFFSVDTAHLSRERQFDVAMAQIQGRLRRFTLIIITIVILAFFGAVVAVCAIYKTQGSPKDHATLEEQRVRDLRKKIMLLRGTWEAMKQGDDFLQPKVKEEGKVLGRQIEALKDNLNYGHLIERDEWAGYAYVMGADAANRLKKPDECYELIDAGVISLLNARQDMKEVSEGLIEHPTDKGWIDLVAAVKMDSDKERVGYLLAVAYALDAVTRGKYNVSDVKREINDLDDIQLKKIEASISSAPYVSDALKTVATK